MMSILRKYQTQKSGQVRELMHWAMLSFDEDGCPLEQPGKWEKRLEEFRRMYPHLQELRECLQALVYSYPPFLHQLWLDLKRKAGDARGDGLSLKELIVKEQETDRFYARWEKKLSRITDELMTEMKWDEPLVQVKGFYFDDVEKKRNDFLKNKNGKVFGEFVTLLRRKVEAVLSLEECWRFDRSGFSDKMSRPKEMENCLARLYEPPGKFIHAPKWSSVDKDDLRDCWVDAFEKVREKLRKGNLDLQGSGDPTILTEGIAANLVKQFLKERPWLAQIEEDEADDTDMPFGSVLWDEGPDQIEAEQLEREAQEISSKLGFDFLSLSKKEKTVLYLGFLLRHRLVPNEEIALVKQVLGLAPDQKVDQEVILQELGLDISQSSLSKRLWGDKKETGRAYGVFYKWVNYTCWAKDLLPLPDYRAGQDDLQAFFDPLSYYELSQKEEAPGRDQPWYESLYQKLKTNVHKIPLSKGITREPHLN